MNFSGVMARVEVIIFSIGCAYLLIGNRNIYCTGEIDPDAEMRFSLHNQS